MTVMKGADSSSPSLNVPLLDCLRAAAGAFVPLDELGPDRDRVRADLDALVDFGFAIERHPYRGAAYAGPAARLCPDQIEHELGTRRIGRRIAVWSRVSSTNDLAARAGGSASNDGLVVLAEEQTAGRGRRGRSWTAPPRSSILMSVLLFPPADVAPAGPDAAEGCAWLTALGAVATAEVVTAWTGREAAIKWPNDVRVDGRKIAGILVERPAPPGRAAVVGIGLNVHVDREALPAELQPRATSIQIERGGLLVDRSEVARELIRRLDHWYDAVRTLGCDTLSAPWRDRSEHLGQVVEVATPAGPRSGRLVDLDLRLGLTLDIEGPGERRHDRRPDERVAAGPRLVRLPPGEILAIVPYPGPDCDESSPWTEGPPWS
jgi:BirA family transcriptional regulator, biotin operon repressor / biotin---[acetyl-CoA-carboxylase] ligase